MPDAIAPTNLSVTGKEYSWKLRPEYPMHHRNSNKETSPFNIELQRRIRENPYKHPEGLFQELLTEYLVILPDDEPIDSNFYNVATDRTESIAGMNQISCQGNLYPKPEFLKGEDPIAPHGKITAGMKSK